MPSDKKGFNVPRFHTGGPQFRLQALNLGVGAVHAPDGYHTYNRKGRTDGGL